MYPVAEDSHGAAAVKRHLTRKMHMAKHVVLNLRVLSGVLVTERDKPLTAHIFLRLVAIWPFDAVFLRPSSGDRIGPARMNAGI